MPTDRADDLATIREQARRMLDDLATPEKLKSLLEAPGSFDRALWDSALEQGWPLVPVPEEAGGLGLGWRGLGLLSEELGRRSASLPVVGNAAAVHALLQAGAGADHVQPLIEGTHIAALALASAQDGGLAGTGVQVVDGTLSGQAAPAPFAAVADVALVAAAAAGGPQLYLVVLDQPGVQRQPVPSYDNARASARLVFDRAQAVPVGEGELLAEISGLAALATGFEQVGGARASLDMACAYARERRAFGQLIGAFQGIKHKLAEIYCLIEIAQGCLDDALEAWEQHAPDRQLLASAARLAASRAYTQAAQENLHVHGGMGVTWEAMPHHFYRRSRTLALELGSQLYWRERLLAQLGVASAR